MAMWRAVLPATVCKYVWWAHHAQTMKRYAQLSRHPPPELKLISPPLITAPAPPPISGRIVRTGSQAAHRSSTDGMPKGGRFTVEMGGEAEDDDDDDEWKVVRRRGPTRDPSATPAARGGITRGNKVEAPNNFASLANRADDGNDVKRARDAAELEKRRAKKKAAAARKRGDTGAAAVTGVGVQHNADDDDDPEEAEPFKKAPGVGPPGRREAVARRQVLTLVHV